jgi:ABC-type dipeptide/oligopeptide/nickel transport system ATPase component
MNDTSSPHKGALQVQDLTVRFDQPSGSFRAVNGVSFSLRPGTVTGLAGESGSGKSTIGMAVMGLLPRSAAAEGSVSLDGQDLLTLSQHDLRRVRGNKIAMVFQELGAALNPVMRIGPQLIRAARAHESLSKKDAAARARDWLEQVQINDPDRVMRSFPEELSGGMAQRVLIAMSLICGSQVLIADEPTTALDVSVQREILDILAELVSEKQLAILFISHDLGVLREISDELLVMYRGEVMESGPTAAVIGTPVHPYSQGLVASVPLLDSSFGAPLADVGGPRFHGREAATMTECKIHPALTALGDDRAVRCWRGQEDEHPAPSLRTTHHHEGAR